MNEVVLISIYKTDFHGTGIFLKEILLESKQLTYLSPLHTFAYEACLQIYQGPKNVLFSILI